MSGYQSIPRASSSASVDGLENGEASSSTATRTDDRDRDLVPTPPSLASKLGYVSFGIVVGCICSRVLATRTTSGGPDDGARTTPRASSLSRLSDRSQRSFVVDGKSFLDSLPFEDVVPLSSWNPSRENRPRDEGEFIDLLSGDHSGAPSSTVDNLNLLSASLLSPNKDPPAPPASGPHLLYHAHASSFSLLYDNSKTTSSSSRLSEYSLDYFLLNSGGFDAQINQAYCAVATVAAVLNSLKYAKRFREEGDLGGWSFDLPVDPRYDPYPYATQEDILAGNDCVWDNVIEHGDGHSEGERGGKVDGIFKPPYGLSLEQSAKLLECLTSPNEWAVTVRNVDPSRLTLSRMRYELKASLIDPDARIMINYDRKRLGQVGGGHFSPLAAYDAVTDSFLIMDVAKYKYPPVWVGADTLYAAMATVDKCGTYDYPRGQEQFEDNRSDGKSKKLFNPITREEYLESLELLNCEKRYRGYIMLKKMG